MSFLEPTAKVEHANEPTKRIKTDRSFADLPPRIIIHEILEYHEMEWYLNEDDPRLELSHFGFFKRDPLRNIWFVFSAVKIVKSTNILLEFKRLTHLFIDYPTPEFLSSVFKHAPQMRLLNTLRIETFKSQDVLSVIQKEMLCQKLSFFSLKRLNIEKCFSQNIFSVPWNIHEENSVFERLTTFTVNVRMGRIRAKCVICKENKERIFDKINKGGVMENLDVTDVKSAIPIELNVPKLKNIRLGGVLKNISIRGGGNIKKMFISQVTEENWKNFERLYRNNPNLEYLRLHGINGYLLWLSMMERRNISVPPEDIPKYSYDFLFRPLYNPLKHLRHLNFNWSGDFPVPKKYWDEVRFGGKKLEELELFHSGSRSKYDAFPEQAFCHNYPRLSNLDLGGPIVKPTKKWDILNQVKTLSYEQEGTFLDLLKFNELKLLEDLETKASTTEDGQTTDVFVLPKLKKIRMKSECCFRDRNQPRYTLPPNDSFFRLIRFPALKILEIVDCPEVTGEGWFMPNFENLEHLVLKNCKNLDDRIFQTDFVFQRLRNLHLEFLESFKGEEWSEMIFPNLGELKFVDVPWRMAMMKQEGLCRNVKKISVVVEDEEEESGVGKVHLEVFEDVVNLLLQFESKGKGFSNLESLKVNDVVFRMENTVKRFLSTRGDEKTGKAGLMQIKVIRMKSGET